MRYHAYIALPAHLGRKVAAVTTPYPGQPPSVPHVTLVGPRAIVTVDREAELVRALQVAARTLPPSTVAYDGTAFFGIKEYIYIVVLLTPWLARCHDACNRAVEGILEPPFQPPLGFRPHITLAARLSEGHGAAMWQRLKDVPFTGSFRCREIHLMRQSGRDAPWHRLARLRLAARSSD